MIIADLNYLEVAEVAVEGATGSLSRRYTQDDKVTVTFSSFNNFQTTVNSPKTLSNSAAAGAKGDAINNTWLPTYSFTKADTLAVTEFLGGSFSASTSAAVINLAY
ncbi:MAG TPA: hypothetical protein IGS37_18200 [Synechococcales cyanobacterium M55_K2018_004]|nr:hypothetical protein [Synechococcales cyanobacterium M55_K2018_004]